MAFLGFVESFLRSPDIIKRYRGRNEVLRNIGRTARQLAREIEKLVPAIDCEKTPQNAEYPWEEDGKIVSPRDYEFPNLHSLRSAEGFQFLRLLKTAFTDFEEIDL